MGEPLETEHKRVTINVSSAALVKLLLFFLLAIFLYLIREIVALVGASLILAMALDPWVDWLQKKRLPRALAVLIIYLALSALFILGIVLLIPPLVQQVADIIANFPAYWEQVRTAVESLPLLHNTSLEQQLSSRLNELGPYVGRAVTGTLGTLLDVFGGIVSFIVILVITLYFVTSEEGMKAFVRKITPKPHQTYILDLIDRMQLRLGLWLRGQLLLSLLIFLLTYIGLLIVGSKYALLLAFLAGLFEVIPFLGPILAAIPGLFFALAQSPTKALLVLIVYVAVQQAENHLIAPRVMGKSVDLNPVVVILVVLIGAKLGGVMGALLAVPVASALALLLEDVLERKTKREAEIS